MVNKSAALGIICHFCGWVGHGFDDAAVILGTRIKGILIIRKQLIPYKCLKTNGLQKH